jgi:hypothetical protein
MLMLEGGWEQASSNTRAMASELRISASLFLLVHVLLRPHLAVVRVNVWFCVDIPVLLLLHLSMIPSYI